MGGVLEAIRSPASLSFDTKLTFLTTTQLVIPGEVEGTAFSFKDWENFPHYENLGSGRKTVDPLEADSGSLDFARDDTRKGFTH